MDTITLIFLCFVGAISTMAIAVTIWLFRQDKRLERRGIEIASEVERQIRAGQSDLARAIVQQHNDPQWREEWLQKIAQAEREK